MLFVVGECILMCFCFSICFLELFPYHAFYAKIFGPEVFYFAVNFLMEMDTPLVSKRETNFQIQFHDDT